MTTIEGERRQMMRRSDVGEHGILEARVRFGPAASVIDVSAGGALVETDHRLLPGTTVELVLKTSARVTSARGRVLRCSIVRLGPEFVCYRGAVGFERPLTWLIDEELGHSIPNHDRRPGGPAG
jgi:hypothetical protein